MKKATVTPTTNPLGGSLKAARDKSLSHRAAMIGALSQGRTEISGFSFCQDCLSTLNCLRAMGISFSLSPEEEKVIIESSGSLHEPENVIDAGNSGTTIRLLSGIAAGIEGLTVLTGDESLRNRPMRRIIEPLRLTGASIGSRAKDRFPPIFILGKNQLDSFSYQLKVASAQVKSSLIFAALRGNGPSFIEEPFPSRDHTENMLRYLGVEITKSKGRLKVTPPRELRARDFNLPGDISSAAFLLAAAILVEGSRVVVEDVGLNPTRCGFLEALREMGAKVTVGKVREDFGELRGEVEASYSKLRGIELGPDKIPAIIDEIPILSLLATQAEGKTTIWGAEELRVKESDRLRAIACGFSQLGAQVEEKKDGLIIQGGSPLKGGRVKSFNDHRIAMSLVIAGLISQKEVTVEGVDCIEISYPQFFDHLQQLGCPTIKVDFEK